MTTPRHGDPEVAAPSALRQFPLLVELWWRHMRRRPTRPGEQPKVSGVPTFLLITIFSSAYMALIVWRAVELHVRRDLAMFTWHSSGVLLLGFASGISKGAVRLQVRGMRNDAFLEALPLTSLARLGLQLTDTLSLMPLSLVVPLAALLARDTFSLALAPAVPLGLFAFVACFIAGQATIAWARALVPAAAGRWGSYLGVFLNVAGLSVLFMPIGDWWVGNTHALAVRWARLWIGPRSALFMLYGLALALSALAYRALRAAEHFGLDQLDPQTRAPTAHKGSRDRVALEWLMLLRQGGRALLVLFSLLALGATWLLVWRPDAQLPDSVLLVATGFVVYLGAIQTFAQAGRAARADLLARPLLAALPLSPHQVLDGKTRALRLLLIPTFLLLALLAGFALARADFDHAYRAALSLCALYVIVEGAVSVAFLSTGIGVLGVGAAQSNSGFSTQVLMLPLFATALAPNAWAATTACIAVVAVSWESSRAARLSVRWLDDPADDVERETTVWRALLAASGFFAAQALSFRMLSFFDLRHGYLFSLAFGASALLLVLLTWRNAERIDRPRFVPERLWYWPLGVLCGAVSGLLAHEIAVRLPPPIDAGIPAFTRGEMIAMVVTMTVIAPLVEEYFFRGWLQRAIAADLPADKKRWAFVLGATAFALAHFGTYGVPQLVLGLMAGALFAAGGGLWPSILAHAMHNGVVLWLAHGSG